jgi:hypothetical protein
VGIITNSSCFSGFYKVSKQCQDVLDEYILQFEESILQRLLGCELFDLFKADLASGVPQAQIYKDIFDPFCIDITSSIDCECNDQVKSFGMKEMATAMVYFYYMRDNDIRDTAVGKVMEKNSFTSKPELSEIHTNIEERWNRGVQSYQSIQYKIKENITDYPTFAGVKEEYSFYGGAF